MIDLIIGNDILILYYLFRGDWIDCLNEYHILEANTAEYYEFVPID